MQHRRGVEKIPNTSSTIDESSTAEIEQLVEALAQKLLSRSKVSPTADAAPALRPAGAPPIAISDGGATTLAEKPDRSQRASRGRLRAVEKIAALAPASGGASHLISDDPPPASESFNLSQHAGRVGFLWSLFSDHEEHGLLMAVNRVWNCLASPRGVRCEMMAARLNLGGERKQALTNVLAKYLHEMLYEVDFPALPLLAD